MPRTQSPLRRSLAVLSAACWLRHGRSGSRFPLTRRSQRLPGHRVRYRHRLRAGRTGAEPALQRRRSGSRQCRAANDGEPGNDGRPGGGVRPGRSGRHDNCGHPAKRLRRNHLGCDVQPVRERGRAACPSGIRSESRAGRGDCRGRSHSGRCQRLPAEAVDCYGSELHSANCGGAELRSVSPAEWSQWPRHLVSRLLRRSRRLPDRGRLRTPLSSPPSQISRIRKVTRSTAERHPPPCSRVRQGSLSGDCQRRTEDSGDLHPGQHRPLTATTGDWTVSARVSSAGSGGVRRLRAEQPDAGRPLPVPPLRPSTPAPASPSSPGESGSGTRTTPSDSSASRASCIELVCAGITVWRAIRAATASRNPRSCATSGEELCLNPSASAVRAGATLPWQTGQRP